MKITSFQNIAGRGKDLLHDLPREKALLQQDHSSQEEEMNVLSSMRDQEK